jgi:hypothetical protein
MICPGCGSESFGATFTGDGPRHKCNGCGNLFDPALLESNPVDSNVSIELPKVSAARPKATAATTITGTGSLLKSARARVRELNREINRLKSLTKERDELRRLIAAAKQPSPKRTATVHKLRANGE